MTEELKHEILRVWNRYVEEHSRRLRKNEASTAQHEDYCKIFKQGIVNHQGLSKKEKGELLVQIGFMQHPAN